MIGGADSFQPCDFHFPLRRVGDSDGIRALFPRNGGELLPRNGAAVMHIVGGLHHQGPREWCRYIIE